MKGIGYGLTLIVILLVTNLMLYIYGIDLTFNTWIGVGGTERVNATEYIPGGEVKGDIQSTSGINEILITLAFVVGVAIASGVVANILTGQQILHWTIPLALIFTFVTFFLSPMGNIIGTEGTPENMYCYKIRNDVVRFGMGGNNPTPINMPCLPTEIHLLLIIFFGLLVIATFMSFMGGREW